MTEQSQANLESLVKNYLATKDQHKDICERHQNLKAPESPISVADLAELKRLSLLRTKYKVEKTELETKRQEISRQLSNQESDIILQIPVKCVWVKVGELAVSTYYDVWGGGHMELDIKPWSDNLPEQTDKTYYA